MLGQAAPPPPAPRWRLSERISFLEVSVTRWGRRQLWADGTTGICAQDRSPIIKITFSMEFSCVCVWTHVYSVSEGWGSDPAGGNFTFSQKLFSTHFSSELVRTCPYIMKPSEDPEVKSLISHIPWNKAELQVVVRDFPLSNWGVSQICWRI